MKIKDFALTHLNNEGHFQFDTDVVGLIESATAESLRIESFYTAFKEHYNQEASVIEKIRKDTLTSHIAAKDGLRDNISKGIFTYVDAFHFCDYSPEKREAAINIDAVIGQYGDFRRKPYIEETATITNFISDLRTRCADEIVTIGLTSWIDALEKANNEFAGLMGDRFDKAARELQATSSKVRLECDAFYHEIVGAIHTFCRMYPTDPVYADFIAKLNARIDYYKAMLNRKEGN